MQLAAVCCCHSYQLSLTMLHVSFQPAHGPACLSVFSVSYCCYIWRGCLRPYRSDVRQRTATRARIRATVNGSSTRIEFWYILFHLYICGHEVQAVGCVVALTAVAGMFCQLAPSTTAHKEQWQLHLSCSLTQQHVLQLPARGVCSVDSVYAHKPQQCSCLGQSCG